VNELSIYPEFFKTGIDRLQKYDARNGDFLGLFSALGHFRRDIADRPDAKSILEATELYIRGLDLFQTIGFFLVNPVNFDFEFTQCTPQAAAESLQGVVRQEKRSGRFAWALRQSTATFFDREDAHGPVRGVFHTLGVPTQRLGMFCGILRPDRSKSHEVPLSLLSNLLDACSDALGRLRTTENLRNEVLAAHTDLQRALKENEVLARIPEESPNPVLRLGKSGQVLYGNQTGGEVLSSLGWRIGDFISGAWMDTLNNAFVTGAKVEFEAVFQGKVYTFLVVPVPEEGYANFYGTDITARKTAETERERLIGELKEALASVKTLSGLVPICAWCKKIRDDRGFWKDVEVFVQSHSDATFSHGVCPECRTKWFEKRAAKPGFPPTD
jgi:PAS domain-containing protein